MAYFVAARSNPQSPEQGKISNQATEKGGQSSSSSTAMALEQANGSQDDVGSKKIVNVENSTGLQDEVGSKEIVGVKNSTGTKTREASASDAVETEKLLERKKVYDKGKAKVAELEKEPKKLLLGNKGIVIRVLDEEAMGELVFTTQKDQLLEEVAGISSLLEGMKSKE